MKEKVKISNIQRLKVRIDTVPGLIVDIYEEDEKYSFEIQPSPILKNTSVITYEVPKDTIDTASSISVFVSFINFLITKFPKFEGTGYGILAKNGIDVNLLKNADTEKNKNKHVPTIQKPVWNVDEFKKLATAEYNKYKQEADKYDDFVRFGIKLVSNAKEGKRFKSNFFINNYENNSKALEYLYRNYLQALRDGNNAFARWDYASFRRYQNALESNLSRVNVLYLEKGQEAEAYWMIKNLYNACLQVDKKLIIFSEINVKNIFKTHKDDILIDLNGRTDTTKIRHVGIQLSGWNNF